ncbi:hypothetical protein ACQPXM_35005 [Kribbella sp. CA-253562]|uniref:hypothetical protein n=1 Tax=Kribbella sp. CA-253562 TaxID=3239942 RepID=UPI003D8F29AD
MNRTTFAVAVPVLALGAIGVGAGAANAKVPDDPTTRGNPPGALSGQPVTVEVPVDDGVSEAVQAGASALGGAGIACTALWLYRRRPVLG